MRDPYSILGVKRSADPDEIKAAWRSKAKTIHPDHNQDDPTATDKFAEVGQAYELLKDPERRRRYDTASDMHQTIMQQRQAAERAKAARENAEKVMEELARAQAARAQAEAAKAGSAKAKAQSAGKAQGATKAGEKTADKSAERQEGESPEETIERIFGASAEARERAREHADATASTAEARSEDPAAKDEPHAEGRPPLPQMAVEMISNLVNRLRGTAPPPEKAPDLSVDAKVTIADFLGLKAATVKLADEREVRVPIERGAMDGQVVRLAGQGLKLPGMKQGDLLITLKAIRDERFQLDGFDLHTVLPISLQDAVLGGEARVETPEGPRSIDIPSWSGSDRTLRLEGLGLHNDAGGRGDLVVELRIMLWEKPDDKVTDLMRHMRDGLFL